MRRLSLAPDEAAVSRFFHSQVSGLKLTAHFCAGTL
jgi:hypothetical protein